MFCINLDREYMSLRLYIQHSKNHSGYFCYQQNKLIINYKSINKYDNLVIL